MTGLEQLRASLAVTGPMQAALIQRPRVPVVIDRIGLYQRTDEDGWLFQVLEILDTGRARALTPIEVGSPWAAAVEADVSELVSAWDGVIETADLADRDVIRSNTFGYVRAVRRELAEGYVR